MSDVSAQRYFRPESCFIDGERRSATAQAAARVGVNRVYPRAGHGPGALSGPLGTSGSCGFGQGELVGMNTGDVDAEKHAHKTLGFVPVLPIGAGGDDAKAVAEMHRHGEQRADCRLMQAAGGIDAVAGVPGINDGSPEQSPAIDVRCVPCGVHRPRRAG